MKKTDFLELFNEIDDDFVNELSELPEKPRRISFFRPLLSAAAVLCVIAVGVFAYAKLNKPQTVSPNESGSSQGDAFLSNEPDDSLSIIPENKFERVEMWGYEFSFRLTERDSPHTDPVMKIDSEDTAISITCTGVSKENPLIIGVYDKEKLAEYYGRTSNRNATAGRLVISESGTHDYYLTDWYYGEPPIIGEEYFLVVTATGSATVSGKWLP